MLCLQRLVETVGIAVHIQNIRLEREKPKIIIEGMGIDPYILGASRINGIKGYILRGVRTGKGFAEITSEEVATQTGRPIIPETKIRRLEHELAYTKQELEFIKKIIAAGREEGK